MKVGSFLGHIIDNGTICTGPDKAHIISDFPYPKTVKHLRWFLGICLWYQQFVPNLVQSAKIATLAGMFGFAGLTKLYHV